LRTFIVILIVLLALAAVVGGAGFVVVRNGMLGGKAEAPRVRVEPAVAGPLVEVVSVPGTIAPRRRVEIRPKVAARIARLPHLEGADVVAAPLGTTRPSDKSLLVELDAKDLRAALDAAEARRDAQSAQIDVSKKNIEAREAQVRATRATVEDAIRDRDRKVALAKDKDVSQAEADTAVSRAAELEAQLASAEASLAGERENIRVLDAQLRASKAEIDRATEELSYTVIASPIDGTIIRLNAEVGEQVVPGIQGSQGSVILEVADLSEMLMLARVDEANVSSVRPGQRAIVRIQAYRDEAFEGRVESVALAKPEQKSAAARGGGGGSGDGTNYYEAKIRLVDLKGRRIPTGLNADAEIEAATHEGVRVPSQAVLGRSPDQLPADARSAPEVEPGKSSVSVVFRFVNGKAVATPVKVGASDETHTLILSGLKPNEPIISGPYKALDALAHDQAVTKEDVAAKQPTSRPAGTMPATRPSTAPATAPS